MISLELLLSYFYTSLWIDDWYITAWKLYVTFNCDGYIIPTILVVITSVTTLTFTGGSIIFFYYSCSNCYFYTFNIILDIIENIKRQSRWYIKKNDCYDLKNYFRKQILHRQYIEITVVNNFYTLLVNLILWSCHLDKPPLKLSARLGGTKKRDKKQKYI